MTETAPVPTPTLDLDDYYSLHAAAKRKKVSHESLRQAVNRGALRGVKVNARLTLVHKDDLRTYRPQKDRQRAGRAGAKAKAAKRKARG